VGCLTQGNSSLNINSTFASSAFQGLHNNLIGLSLTKAVGSFSVIFLDTLARLRKATISFFMSVYPHGTTLFPLDGFSQNFYI
jgi:hypothetical protein